MNNDAFSIFAAIDTLVLERTSGRSFRCLGTPPEWCAELWPVCAHGAEELAPELAFPFLEVFLGEAERAWAAPTRVDSETWTRVDEQGNEIHLQATALRVGPRELLLIARCDALHQARQQLLQRARELRLAHDVAARASEQKDVLVHCIIHDLQVPLSTILSAVAQLHEEARSENVARLASSVLQAAQRQRELILDILQLFAPEPETPGTTELVSVINSAAALFEPVARARGQTVTWDPSSLGGAGVRVVGDAHRLGRVIANLVENAVRNALGAISIELRRDGRDACVIVEDDGPPPSADTVPRLFAGLGDLHGDDGSGLGLYFCRITVERWGGSIGYEPRPTGGTRLWLRLPVATVTNAKQAARSTAVAR